MSKDWVTTLDAQEAAALVGVSADLVWKWVRAGALRPVRLTLVDRMRFLEDEVVACAEAHRSDRKSRRLERMTRRWQKECASVN